MTRARTFFRSSFGSALFGGIVAVAIGIVAIATGLISVDNSSGSAPVAATHFRPASMHRIASTRLMSRRRLPIPGTG